MCLLPPSWGRSALHPLALSICLVCSPCRRPSGPARGAAGPATRHAAGCRRRGAGADDAGPPAPAPPGGQAQQAQQGTNKAGWCGEAKAWFELCWGGMTFVFVHTTWSGLLGREAHEGSNGTDRSHLINCCCSTPRSPQSCLVKNLHRSRLAAATGTLCDAQDRRVRGELKEQQLLWFQGHETDTCTQPWGRTEHSLGACIRVPAKTPSCRCVATQCACLCHGLPTRLMCAALTACAPACCDRHHACCCPTCPTGGCG